MRSGIYRYRFSRRIRWLIVDRTLVSAIAATKALYGEARSRLEIGYAQDPNRKTLIVDATSPAGRAFARIVAGLLINRFGADAVRIEPVVRRRRKTALSRR